MGTGLDSFTNPEEIGALYPFAGTEVLLAVVGVLLWIGWQVRQMMQENREYDEALAVYREVGVVDALEHNGIGSPAGGDGHTDENREAVPN